MADISSLESKSFAAAGDFFPKVRRRTDSVFCLLVFFEFLLAVPIMETSAVPTSLRQLSPMPVSSSSSSSSSTAQLSRSHCRHTSSRARAGGKESTGREKMWDTKEAGKIEIKREDDTEDKGTRWAEKDEWGARRSGTGTDSTDWEEMAANWKRGSWVTRREEPTYTCGYVEKQR